MLTKVPSQGERGVWLGVAILALGFAIGQFVDLGDWLQGREERELGSRPTLVEPRGPFADDAGVEPVDNGLETLHLEFTAASAERLGELRELALVRRQIERSEGDQVPVTVTVGGRSVEAYARLKGDAALDHVDTDKWSLRIELEDELLGMSRFSIQHPKVRRYLWEWLTLAVARHEGLLAPRSRFVNVVTNGRPGGVYYLEEHFSTPMIESQGRRNGPIVRFREEVFWATHGHNRTIEKRDHVSQLLAGNAAFVAEIEAYGEKKLVQSEATRRQLAAALDKLRDTQRRIIADSAQPLSMAVPDQRQQQVGIIARRQEAMRADWLARVHALTAERAASVEELFHVETCGRQAAFMSLFQGKHGLIWHNMRFYHDPVRNRLEPLVFDTGAGGEEISGVNDPIWTGSQVGLLWSKSPRFILHAYRELARLTEPEYLDEIQAALGPELERYERALQAEGMLPATSTARHIWEQLRYRQAHLGGVLHQPEPAAFFCQLVGGGDAFMSGTLTIEAWSTTRVPVRVEGFQFSNGRLVKAADVVESDDPDVLRIGDAVVLPTGGRRVQFHFPVDDRLATLREFDQITRAVNEGVERARDVRLELSARFAPVGSDLTRDKLLSIRQVDLAWDSEGGRPEPPSLSAALASQPCLSYDVEGQRLSLRAGVWDLDQDLLVPRGMILHCGPGVTLRFAAGKALISASALSFMGTLEAPIVIEPREGVSSFGGIVVVDARGESRWANVTVRRAAALARSGWVTTGGVTFYRSALLMRDCRMESAEAEDALNVVGATVLLDRVAFQGSRSDAFDGDFVRGQLLRCTFRNIGADGVDTSGSEVTLEGCRFYGIGDKAISAGEASRLTVQAATIEGTSIGVASKDGSTVLIEASSIQGARYYGLAAFVKKVQYGPSRIEALTLAAADIGLDLALAQTGCEVKIDGTAVATADVDVKQLYKEKILGQ
ncbi:MAG: hypothetical protein ACI8QZ_000273 [Chlamydiales bacterium]|jgi:hypothetical protein